MACGNAATGGRERCESGERGGGGVRSMRGVGRMSKIIWLFFTYTRVLYTFPFHKTFTGFIFSAQTELPSFENQINFAPRYKFRQVQETDTS